MSCGKKVVVRFCLFPCLAKGRKRKADTSFLPGHGASMEGAQVGLGTMTGDRWHLRRCLIQPVTGLEWWPGTSGFVLS